MLLQTNSYIVPKERKAEHSRLIRRFRQTLYRLGCDHFEVYEQVGSNWSNAESAGRYVQILRFVDRKHQLAVQAAERIDPTAQAVIADFCELINFPYQQQQGLFAVGFYTSVLPVAPKRGVRGELVSTVEHEVIDDPEAEKPYPGASDGPPLDDSDEASDPAIIEAVISTEKNQPVEDEFAIDPTEVAIKPEVPPSIHEHHSMANDPAHANSNAELESLVELEPEEELEPEAELSEADEDRAHGFIEADLMDDLDNEHHSSATPHASNGLSGHGASAGPKH